MLLVDFFFSLPAFYSRDLDYLFEDGSSYQHRNGHQAAHPQYARYSIILFSTVAMILKIYFLCVVWKCYRYLRLIELVTPIRLSEIYPHLPPAVRVLGSIDSTDLSSGHNVTPPPYESVASSMKPPNYEEAIKSSGTVFTVNSPMNSNIDNNPPPPQQQQQAQQTVVFTIPSSEQYQNVSTQIVGNPSETTAGAARPTTGDGPTTTTFIATTPNSGSITINMSGHGATPELAHETQTSSNSTTTSDRTTTNTVSP